MSQLRLDPLTGRWVIVTAARGERPNAFLERSAPFPDSGQRCPFCPGHEEDTPPTVATYNEDGAWQVRIARTSTPHSQATNQWRFRTLVLFTCRHPQVVPTKSRSFRLNTKTVGLISANRMSIC